MGGSKRVSELTPEELAKRREYFRNWEKRNRKHRAVYERSPQQLARKREADRKRQQEKRDRETSNERKERYKKGLESQKLKRQNPEFRSQCNEKSRKRYAKRKLTMPEEQLVKKRKRDNELHKRKRAARTEEQIKRDNDKWKVINANRRIYVRLMCRKLYLRLTGKPKQIMLQKKAALHRIRIARMTPEELKIYHQVQRTKKKLWYANLDNGKKLLLLQRQNARQKQPKNCVRCGKRVTLGGLTYHGKTHDFFKKQLRVLSKEERDDIELKTRQGFTSFDWRRQRLGRITASRMSKVLAKWQTDTRPYSIVRGMLTLSGRGFQNGNMSRGIRLEPTAIEKWTEWSAARDVQYPVGFIVHPTIPYLGATPDALVETDGVVEVKCPIVPMHKLAVRSDRMVERCSKREAGTFLKTLPGRRPSYYRLRRNHCYFTQVVAEIMCSDRQYCEFVIYFENDKNTDRWELWRERITRSEAEKEWERMEPKLRRFYMNFCANGGN